MTTPPHDSRSGSVRRLSVKSLTRVEGEGSLRVRVADGRIEIAEFSIYEPPRFFEKLVVGREIREVPDIVARICGICPVAYQLTACHALEQALGIEITPPIRMLRRLLGCGEWIQSHALHVHLLHAPDFFGCESGFTLAEQRPTLVESGMRLKSIGSRLIEVLGGRAVHPINVTVGGFHRSPSPASLRELLPDLKWGLGYCLALVNEVSEFAFPAFARGYHCMAVSHPAEYPLNEGRIMSSSGLDIDAGEFPQHVSEQQVPWSTALQSVLMPDEQPYLVGPLARVNLCHDRLPPAARAAAENCGHPLPLTNPFMSIVARCVELAAAFEEAAEIVQSTPTDLRPCHVAWSPRAGVGCHATEAPRGLLWHRYEIGADGLVKAASIVPPTSQNQAQIEADLRDLLPPLLKADDATLTQACESLIRCYDPCISCATHFLRLDVDRMGNTDP
ncbi:MAG: Ni/Fe hydrogenase subunit alpha [Pirellulales bacterium]